MERATRASGLYKSTSVLLCYIANSCESAMGPDLAREALRLLSERLYEVCALKEALHGAPRMQDAAAKAARIGVHLTGMGSRQGPVGAAAQGRHPPLQGGSGYRATANVTDDTTNSSPAAGGGTAGAGGTHALPPALPSGDTLARLLDTARGVSRFAGLLCRSSLGFQVRL